MRGPGAYRDFPACSGVSMQGSRAWGQVVLTVSQLGPPRASPWVWTLPLRLWLCDLR